MGFVLTFGATGFFVTALLAWLLVMVVAARSFEPAPKAAKPDCPTCRRTLQGSVTTRRPYRLAPPLARPRMARVTEGRGLSPLARGAAVFELREPQPAARELADLRA